MNSIGVLYDNQIFAMQRYGGVSRIFYELIRHLSINEQLDISLFQGVHFNDFPLCEIKDKLLNFSGKKIHYYPFITEPLKVLNRFYFNRFVKGKKFNIYHPTNYSPLVYQWKQSMVALFVNDMIPELFPDSFPDIKSRLKIKKKCILRADMIITISHNTKSDLLKFYDIPPNKIRVIYPGAPSLPIQGREPKPFLHPRPYILYVGTRRQNYKNFVNFYLAFSSSKRLTQEFDLICFGGKCLNKKELQYMNRACYPVNVYQPPGDENILPQLYRGASALVYPSLYEGFGLPPLEAMVYGCPVIASKRGAVPEVLGEAAAYFDPIHKDSIKASMELVLFKKGLRNQLIKKGKLQVKKYSWEKMSEEVFQVYQEMDGTQSP